MTHELADTIAGENSGLQANQSHTVGAVGPHCILIVRRESYHQRINSMHVVLGTFS